MCLDSFMLLDVEWLLFVFILVVIVYRNMFMQLVEILQNVPQMAL
jgi:hypothetical protein